MNFPEFCLQFIDKNSLGFILPLMCGDIADMSVFVKNSLKVLDVDITPDIIDNDLEIKPKYIYLRSNLNKKNFTKYLEWAGKNLSLDGKFFIECAMPTDEQYICPHLGDIRIKGLVDDLYDFNLSVEYITQLNNETEKMIRVTAIKSDFIIPKPNVQLMQVRNKFVDFINICNDNNIEIIAADGTLLGAVRCNGIIPWDTDLDVSISYDNFIKLCDADFVKNGNWMISGCGGLDENEKPIVQSHQINSSDIIKNFNLNKELIWIVIAGILSIQIIVYQKDEHFKSKSWGGFEDDTFMVRIYRDHPNFREESNRGANAIPLSLFYPLIKVPFYSTNIYVHEKSDIILKKWYGNNCLTHYPEQKHRLDTGLKLIKHIYSL